MNLFKHEFISNFKSLLIWTVSLLFLYGVASIEFEAYYGNAQIADAMAQFEIVFQALGTSAADMTTPEGFLSILSVYIYLPLGIYSGMLGASIISKEEKDKTAEFLFTLPVSRQKVLGYKGLTAVLNTFLINLISMVGIFIIYSRFEADKEFIDFIVHLSIGVFLTQLIFLGIGLVLASVLNQFKLSGAITVILLTATYLINILIGFVEELDFLQYITPFAYFPSSKMLEGTYEPVFVIITLVVFITSFAGVFYFYPKRDLSI
jgi:ABC-2 type transport system permease protein